MKLLVFSEETDTSSDIVCSWLQKNNIPYIRINSEKFVNPQLKITETPDTFSVTAKYKGETVDFSKVETVWFRRGYMYIYPFYAGKDIPSTIINELNKHIKNESLTLKQYVYNILSSKKNINHPDTYNYNKLIALHEAAKLGFNIPITLVSGNKKDISNFVKENVNCITKSIQDMYSINSRNVHSTIGKIAQVNVNDITEDFYWYSLFQKEIPKKYELRIFYFLGKLYSMAIFSQLDSNSKLDFREVDANGNHPNRMVPFIIPRNIKIKLIKLMKQLKLESGSIDIIVTPQDEYYFLEVNPVGQFNFVSEICNYYIEKDIAKYLAK